MFTGIITDVGELVAREGSVFEFACHYPADDIAVGGSIACDGCCLTVTSRYEDGGGARFKADVSNETMSKTTLGNLQQGQSMNFERALKAGDELGGHLVTGHVDGVARVVDIAPDGDSRRFEFEVPEGLGRFIAKKGSIALNGTSLTVNAVAGERFTVNLIPHTLTHTTWGRKKPGDHINVEVDIFARYVARVVEYQR